MIKHIVLWKLDASYSETEKSDVLNVFKAKLLALNAIIPQLKSSLSVGFNSKDAPEANYDIALESTFDTIKDLDAYQIHPEHLKVVEFVKSLKRERACIDFEF
jgi:hypothetical protein